MKPAYEDIVKWISEYLAAYNAYAQNPETVDRMSAYFTPDVKFVPYVSAFGGPQNAVTNRDDFFRMFTGHPTVYEQFEVESVAVDERQMVAVALLKVTLFDSKTNEVLVRKHYLPRYQLVLDDKNRLKISTILFFWEASPPEVDAAYAIDTAM
jgi:ketosteroid isomerase-like protein